MEGSVGGKNTPVPDMLAYDPVNDSFVCVAPAILYFSAKSILTSLLPKLYPEIYNLQSYGDICKPFGVYIVPREYATDPTKVTVDTFQEVKEYWYKSVYVVTYK